MKIKNYTLWVLFAFLTFYSESQITIYPNTTDFESESLCGTSCTGSCNPTGTWRNADQFSFPQAGTDWLVEDGATPSSTTGPDIDHTLSNTAGKYMYVETSGCNNISAHLVSDIYDFSVLSAPKIDFYYHMLGATMGTMHFDVDTTGLGDWALDVVPAWTDNINAWQLKSINLIAFAGETSIRLRIRATTGTSFTSDMAVDDIVVYEPVANDIQVLEVQVGGNCGNSTTETVTLTWMNAGADTIPASTSIYFTFIEGSNTIIDTFNVSSPILPGDTLNHVFTNGFVDLSGSTYVPITAYSSWILDISNGNDTTNGSFLGIPIINSYPYFEDFETGQNGWTIHNISNGTWAFGTPTKTVINSAGSGANCFVTGGLSGSYLDNDNSYIEGPCFDFSTMCDPVIDLKVFWNAEFSWDGMNITYSTDGGLTYQLLGALGDPINWYTDNSIAGNPGGFQVGWSGRVGTSNGSGTWLTAKHRMPALANLPNVKLRINFGTDGSVTDEGVAFDDIHIYNSMDLGADQLICAPSTLTLDATNGNTLATYLWNDGTPISQIVIDTTGTFVVTMTDGLCVVNDTIHVVSLDANSQINLGSDVTTCDTIYSISTNPWISTSYLWSTGETNTTIDVNLTHSYSLEATNACGVYYDTIYVYFAPTPVVDLGVDSVSCDSIQLDAQNAGATYNWNTGEFTQVLTAISSNTYSVTVTNSDGCFESDTVVVTINSPSSFTQTFNECDGFSISVGTSTYSTSGIFVDTLVNALGCDSIITTDLTIAAPIVATITNVNDTLIVNESGTYQWFDCNTNSPIAGETNATFVPTSNGSYAVEITNGNCSQLSACELINDLSLTNVTKDWVTIYPNPTKNLISISSGSIVANRIEIYSSNGAKIKEVVPTAFITSIDLMQLDNGMYFVNVTINDTTFSYKVTKQ